MAFWEPNSCLQLKTFTLQPATVIHLVFNKIQCITCYKKPVKKGFQDFTNE